jgi:hypothetical protein
MTACAGSPTGVGVTDTSPAPIPRRLLPVRIDATVRRLWALAPPPEAAARPETSGAWGAAMDGISPSPGPASDRLAGPLATPELPAARPHVSQ